MGLLTQNHMERLQDMVAQGVMTPDQANVEKVKTARFQLVHRSLPRQVRTALNRAVKNGELGHMKRDGRKPEVYYHPTFDYLAREARRKHEIKTLKALAGVVDRPH